MIRAIPLALAIGLIAAGCGSDDSGQTTTTSAPTVSIPPVTAPGVTTATAPTASAPAPTATAKGGATYNPTLPDSATNDVPPAKGSPQEQFEKQCKQNPSACG